MELEQKQEEIKKKKERFLSFFKKELTKESETYQGYAFKKFIEKDRKNPLFYLGNKFYTGKNFYTTDRNKIESNKTLFFKEIFEDLSGFKGASLLAYKRFKIGELEDIVQYMVINLIMKAIHIELLKNTKDKYMKIISPNKSANSVRKDIAVMSNVLDITNSTTITVKELTGRKPSIMETDVRYLYNELEDQMKETWEFRKNQLPTKYTKRLKDKLMGDNRIYRFSRVPKYRDSSNEVYDLAYVITDNVTGHEFGIEISRDLINSIYESLSIKEIEKENQETLKKLNNEKDELLEKLKESQEQNLDSSQQEQGENGKKQESQDMNPDDNLEDSDQEDNENPDIKNAGWDNTDDMDNEDADGDIEEDAEDREENIDDEEDNNIDREDYQDNTDDEENKDNTDGEEFQDGIDEDSQEIDKDWGLDETIPDQANKEKRELDDYFKNLDEEISNKEEQQEIKNQIDRLNEEIQEIEKKLEKLEELKDHKEKSLESYTGEKEVVNILLEELQEIYTDAAPNINPDNSEQFSENELNGITADKESLIRNFDFDSSIGPKFKYFTTSTVATDWVEELAQWLKSKKTRNILSYMRPNKRTVYMGLTLPSHSYRKPDTVGRIVAYIDVSSSMSRETITKILDTLLPLRREFKDLEFKVFNTNLFPIKIPTHIGQGWDFPSGGGTSVEEVIEDIKKTPRISPDGETLFLIMSDGEYRNKELIELSKARKFAFIGYKCRDYKPYISNNNIKVFAVDFKRNKLLRVTLSNYKEMQKLI